MLCYNNIIVLWSKYLQMFYSTIYFYEWMLYILSQQINKLCHNAIKIFIIAGLVSITSESHAQQ